MPRFTVPLTMNEFKQKCEKYFKISQGEFDPYEFPQHIVNDLAKVNFSFENWEINEFEGYNNYPCGYHTLPNGIPVLFVNAGGDWEFPICFCIYWDGQKMRAYIPENGNIYNKKEKCAYGSEDDWENSINQDELPDGDPEKIIQDVMNRIQIK